MHEYGSQRSATIVSFSGIDGAGKSTQIEALRQHLQALGMKVALIRFWNDVSRLKWIRESTGLKLFKGDKGVGAPDAPITRKDKNIQSWPITCTRLALYCFDALSARSAVKQALLSEADFVIFDRYCYDELANLNLQNPLLHRYVDMLLRVIPRLDKSYLLDADPFHARIRKPEYPLDFVYRNRAAYLQLQTFTGRMTVILPNSVDAVEREVWRHTSEVLNLPPSVDETRKHFSGRPHEETNTLDRSFTRPAV